MFNTYLRVKPVLVQVIVFLAFTFLLIALEGALAPLFLKTFFHIQVTDLSAFINNTSGNLSDAKVGLIAFNTVFSFLLPALIFGYLAAPRPLHYLGFNKVQNGFQIGMVLLLFVAFTFFGTGLDNLLSNLNLGTWANQLQDSRNDAVGTFANMTSVPMLVRNIILVGLLTAISEELYFRAVIFRFCASYRKSGQSWLKPLCVSAFIFAAFHGTVYGFITIFIAGFLLADIYRRTGSLWLNILFHFLNNSCSLIIQYYLTLHPEWDKAVDKPSVMAVFLVGGGVLLLLVYRFFKKTDTPLPEGWSAYTPEQPETTEEDNHNQ